MAWGRFDDLEARTGLLCPPARRVLVAERPEDVVATLNAVEAAVADGDWAFGFVSYEAAPGLDPDLAAAVPSPDDPPLVWFGLCDPPAPVPPIDRRHGSHSPAPSWRPGWSADQHRQAVECVQQHIAAGQTYQCNLTDRLYAEHAGDPLDLYADLVVAQRGAYNAYLDLGRHVIASASPELFVSWQGDLLQTRPMKGTTTRGRTPGEDQQQAAALRASAKERAENLMIVDLLRNDLSRIAQTGTVQVAELFALERYPTLWQLTSQITARPSPGLGLVDVFRALFPCGSVTGAPKARTMQLIRDLEAGPRGVYCGAVGLLAPPDQPVRGRFSVAIRTVVADRATGHAVYGTGSAITWDSDPTAEHAELMLKAAVLTQPRHDHELLETLAWTPTQGLRNLDLHMSRLTDSAAYFAFDIDTTHVKAVLHAAVAPLTAPTRVRLQLARTGNVSVDTSPLPAPSPAPVTLTVDAEPVDPASVWLYHKTTHRQVYNCRAARHPDSDDVVLINQRHEITETTTATLAIRLDGHWWTPPTTSGCLPGVERARLLAAGQLSERVLTLTDLHHAQELAVLNSLRGWRPARLTNNHPNIPPLPHEHEPPLEGVRLGT